MKVAIYSAWWLALPQYQCEMTGWLGRLCRLHALFIKAWNQSTHGNVKRRNKAAARARKLARAMVLLGAGRADLWFYEEQARKLREARERTRVELNRRIYDLWPHGLVEWKWRNDYGRYVKALEMRNE